MKEENPIIILMKWAGGETGNCKSFETQKDSDNGYTYGAISQGWEYAAMWNTEQKLFA